MKIFCYFHQSKSMAQNLECACVIGVRTCMDIKGNIWLKGIDERQLFKTV